MYLIKIELELSNPGMRAALRDCQKMHQLVTGLFSAARKDAEILYRCRVRGALAELYMYSAVPIDTQRILPGMRLAGQRDITSWLMSMEAGDIQGFQILTAPNKKIAGEGSKNSRRRMLRTQEERLNWLSRKAEQGGFRILCADESTAQKIVGQHASEAGGRFMIDAYCYTGRLQITDAEAFRRSIQEGIGPEKAYGLGMLLLAGGYFKITG